MKLQLTIYFILSIVIIVAETSKNPTTIKVTSIPSKILIFIFSKYLFLAMCGNVLDKLRFNAV